MPTPHKKCWMVCKINGPWGNFDESNKSICFHSLCVGRPCTMYRERKRRIQSNQIKKQHNFKWNQIQRRHLKINDSYQKIIKKIPRTCSKGDGMIEFGFGQMTSHNILMNNKIPSLYSWREKLKRIFCTFPSVTEMKRLENCEHKSQFSILDKAHEKTQN